MSELAYRPCVGVMLINARGHVFVGRRVGKDDPPLLQQFVWQMPQGGIDEGEEPLAAALRELREETNVTSVSVLAESADWYSYDLPPEANKRRKYRGQTQKWFALRFTGDEAEIDVERPYGGRHTAEFDAWRWERAALLPQLIVPFKRDVYERVVRDFAHLSGD
ncbi:RNA pyrophosphohydrolase [Methylosinus sporium]|uniref:RNA pyrophosphohydrolase n=1 Tax=Methylosinus sporium TaxID=428 RepID=A0A549T0E4_METSR|nr:MULTISPECIES: RNA pyrophosphohydrolase [Methylosinus]MBU3888198.1 RNA pyrophosphohydrolase [Methylosinus sp. KRF6]TRL35278.1 RNA pyrophosphohydrolase [Methylosinus sporium]